MEYESDDYNENDVEGIKTEAKEDPKQEMKEVIKHYMTRKQLSNLDTLAFLMKKFDELLKKTRSFHGIHNIIRDTSYLTFCGSLKQYQIPGTKAETLLLTHPQIEATIRANLPQINKKRIFSLHIGCVATGRTHYQRDRRPRALFMVDTQLITRAGYGISVDKPIKSNLAQISGIEGLFDKLPKEPLSTVIKELENGQLLAPDVILVGYGIEEMVQILNLQRNKHFSSIIDIRSVIQPGMSYNICYSLDHYATALCNIEKLSSDPLTKCEISMKIFKQFLHAILSNIVHQNRAAIEHLRDKLEKIEKKYSYIDEHNYCGSVCLKPNQYCQCSDETDDTPNTTSNSQTQKSKNSMESSDDSIDTSNNNNNNINGNNNAINNGKSKNKSKTNAKAKKSSKNNTKNASNNSSIISATAENETKKEQ